MKMREALLTVAMIWAIAEVIAVGSAQPRDAGRPAMQLAQYYPVAYGCCTNFGRCSLGAPLPPGAPCYCLTPYGPIQGYAC